MVRVREVSFGDVEVQALRDSSIVPMVGRALAVQDMPGTLLVPFPSLDPCQDCARVLFPVPGLSFLTVLSRENLFA